MQTDVASVMGECASSSLALQRSADGDGQVQC